MESFLAAASFQETTRVLTESAINGDIDYLRGLNGKCHHRQADPRAVRHSEEGRERLGLGDGDRLEPAGTLAAPLAGTEPTGRTCETRTSLAYSMTPGMSTATFTQGPAVRRHRVQDWERMRFAACMAVYGATIGGCAILVNFLSRRSFRMSPST